MLWYLGYAAVPATTFGVGASRYCVLTGAYLAALLGTLGSQTLRGPPSARAVSRSACACALGSAGVGVGVCVCVSSLPRLHKHRTHAPGTPAGGAGPATARGPARLRCCAHPGHLRCLRGGSPGDGISAAAGGGGARAPCSGAVGSLRAGCCRAAAGPAAAGEGHGCVLRALLHAASSCPLQRACLGELQSHPARSRLSCLERSALLEQGCAGASWSPQTFPADPSSPFIRRRRCTARWRARC